MSQELPESKENMQETLMTSKDVVDLYTELETSGIKIWREEKVEEKVSGTVYHSVNVS